MSLKINFGKKLKELREASSITQEKFAELVGIHRNTLARIENGKNFVSFETLVAIKNVLNVSYEDLLSFDTKIQKDNFAVFKIYLNQLDEKDLNYFATCIGEYIKLKNK